MSITVITPEAVKPCRDILFIERDIEDDQFGDSPIVRPENFRAQMGIATVLGVGEDIQDKFAPGDKIYLGKLSGLKVVELNGPYFLVNQLEVLAKVTE